MRNRKPARRPTPYWKLEDRKLLAAAAGHMDGMMNEELPDALNVCYLSDDPDSSHTHAADASDHSHDHDLAEDHSHHQHGSEGIETAGMIAPPAVDIIATNNFDGTATLNVSLSNFNIVETDSTEVVHGEGHMHLYLNGEKVSRLYSLTHTFEDLEPGVHKIEVGLNAHDHSSYLNHGEPIKAETTIVFGNLVERIVSSSGSNSFDHVVVGGGASGDQAGQIKSAGDVNGDGIDDLIIGAPFADANDGAAYVVFGSSAGFGDSFSVDGLDGSNGFKLSGSSAELAGHSVASAGDINGDGFSDVIVGAPAHGAGGIDSGAAYVVFGDNGSFPAEIALSSLSGTNGFRLQGVAADDAAGGAVAAAGDFNDDGLDDFLIGAVGADGRQADSGVAYLVFGDSTFSSTFDLSLLNGSNGTRLNGVGTGNELGYAVSSAGDLNADSIDDIIVGAPGASPGANTAAGSSFVVFGTTTNLGGVFDLRSVNGTSGFRINGVNENDRAGQTLAGNGDVNDDGIEDIIIGSPWAKVDGVSVGAAYVLYGNSTGFSQPTNLSEMTGTEGTLLQADYQSDPLLYSFIVNTTGATSHDVPGQNTGLVEDALVNFTSVISDSDSVFVHTSGIPFQVLGDWGNNPNTVSDQQRTYKLPRNPVEETGIKTATSLGTTGVWIDGVAIFNWSDARSWQDEGAWNRNANYWEAPSFDANGAHPPQGGAYHTHAQNFGLQNDLSDDGSGHSPLLGWSYDGFPIYGSYGYENTDGTGDIVPLRSSWQTRNITVRTHLADGTDVPDGPTATEVPLGAFLEDYEFIAGSGDLDRYNGRFSPTPEYPDGIYHYVATIDENGDSAFPYVIGVEYYGVVETANVGNNGNIGEPEVTPISVAFGGDFNLDGVDDILFGNADAYFEGVGVTGSVNILYGSSSLPGVIGLNLVAGLEGATLFGDSQNELVGQSVDFLDFNGDGLSDLAISAPGADSIAGESTVIFGEPLVADILDVSPDPRNVDAGIVTINFDRDVNGVDTSDFSLTRDGVNIDLSGLELNRVSGDAYTIDLSSVTSTDGAYVLTLDGTAGSGIHDELGQGLQNGAMDSFVVDTVKPTVDSVAINGNEDQRSRITELTVNFSEVVNVDASSFVLTNTDTNQQITLQVATQILSGRTVATLTFTGSGVEFGSLGDGNYSLVTLNVVTDGSGNGLDGDGSGGDYVFGDQASDKFFRLFGDSNGDRIVNVFDLLAFRRSYLLGQGDADFNSALDHNGSGSVNVFDLLQFRSRYGESLPFA